MNAQIEEREVAGRDFRMITMYSDDFVQWELSEAQFMYEETGDAESGPQQEKTLTGWIVIGYGAGEGNIDQSIEYYLRHSEDDCEDMLAEFISSRDFLFDLTTHVNTGLDKELISPQPGYLYKGEYYILEIGGGAWELHLDGGTEVSDDLFHLEKKLFNWVMENM
jgi:roadblock/LC7 domain-containing protein